MKRKVVVHNDLKDMLTLAHLIPDRRRRLAGASTDRVEYMPVNELALQLHPPKIGLVISEIREENGAARTFRFEPDSDAGTEELPYFRAGQYLSFKLQAAGVHITRPYSLSSSPSEAVVDGFYEVTMRKKDTGFVTNHIWREWSAGTKVECSGPCGTFYYDSLRDSKNIIALAGGAGITPFRSMIKDFIENEPDVNFTLLYGIKKHDEIIYREELERLAERAPDRIKVFYVCSESDGSWRGPSGFLSADLINKLADGVVGKSVFICGPQAMYNFLTGELKTLSLPERRVRREVFGEVEDVTHFADFPKDAAGKTFEMKVSGGRESRTVPASATESVLVSLERAGFAPPSQCRSGECGFCNTLLLSGNLFVSPESDGRRMATKKFNFFHPCAAYPVSDIEVRIMNGI